MALKRIIGRWRTIPKLRRVAKIEPNTLTLAYIRRLGVARHFLYASVRGLHSQLSPSQIAEATSQKQQLEKLNQLYTDNVANYLEAMNRSSAQTAVGLSQSVLVRACMAQLRYEREALASGRATVQVKDTTPTTSTSQK